jgi:hypothetical protein
MRKRFRGNTVGLDASKMQASAGHGRRPMDPTPTIVDSTPNNAP